MKLFALIVLLLFGLILNGILVEPLRLLYSERRNIRLLHVDGDRRSQNNFTTTVLAKNLKDAIAVAFHYQDQILFWTDVSLGKILRKSINNDSKVETVVSVGLIRPEGIAIDWVTKKIYWTDSHLKLIEVVNFDGTQRSVLFWENLDKPRAIVVDPSHGYMFWPDWGEKPRIVRASMDGTGRRNVITTDVKWPNDLAVDFREPRLFWLDAHKDYSRLESSNLDGKNRKKLISSSLPHPFSITIYGDRVFWTDWERLSIESCNKKTGYEKWLVKDKIKDVMDLQAFEAERQPDVPNSCAIDNGGCSDLCLLAAGGNHTCACPTGIVLLDDGKTCEDGPQNFVIVARRTELRLISLDTLDRTAILLPIRNMKHVIVIEYDPVERFVYWTDQDLHLIKRAKLDGSEEQVVVQAEVKYPEGIALDWIGRNLYWSDTGTDRIEVSRLNGTSRRVLVSENLNDPRSIAVDPGEGYMYWSDWGSHPRLERAWLDGTHREVLVSTSIQWPNGLALDYIERKIYWADAKLDKIEVCNLNGSGRRVLLDKEVPHIYGFGLIGKHLYWTDWQRRNLQKLHVDSLQNKDIAEFPAVMGLKVVDMRLKYGDNDCQENNGNCSHLCLYTPVGVKCECPMGLEMTKDNMTCVVVSLRLLYSERRNIRLLHVDGDRRSQNNFTTTLLAKNLVNAIAVAFHYQDQILFWTDVSLGKILRKSIKDSIVETVVSVGLVRPEGIAIDWVTKKIYWTDSHLKLIEVVNFDGTQRSVLVWKKLGKPRAIVVDPSHGYMFWSRWGKKPRIVRASMDGTGRKNVITTDVKRPKSLAVDFKDPRLFWLDAFKDYSRLESSNLDGKNRKKIISSSLRRPFSITLYGDRVFWTDRKKLSIESCNKKTGLEKWLVKDKIKKIMDLQAFEAERQPDVKNSCAIDNGGCSDLCFLAAGGNHTCACPTGIVLLDDGKTCEDVKNSCAIDNGGCSDFCLLAAGGNHTCTCPTGIVLLDDGKTCEDVPQEFLLFSRMKSICRISIHTSNGSKPICPIPTLDANAVDFHINQSKVFWTDLEAKKISRAFINGSQAEVVIDVDLIWPDGLAVDWVANNIYWTDSHLERIECSRLDGRYRKTLIWKGLNEPHSLALDPRKGYMYWTEWGDSAAILRANMDGTDIKILIQNYTHMARPRALVIDFFEDMIYWTEGLLSCISRARIDGTGLENVISSSLSYPNCLTQYKDFIYWGDQYDQTISRASKKNGGNRTRIGDNIGYIMDMKIFHNSRQIGWNECGDNDGGCSHLCLALPQEKYTCACPNHYRLDNKTKTSCISPQLFLLYSVERGVRRQTIDHADNFDLFLPLNIQNEVRALEYDLTTDMIYWIDACDDHADIYRSFPNGTQKEEIVTSDDKKVSATPLDIALDPYGKQLYWTDDISKNIKVTSLTTNVVGTLVSDELGNPTSIALDTKRGYMYWTSFTDKTASIEKARMSGGRDQDEQVYIKDVNNVELGPLVVDPDGEYLYFVEKKRHKFIRLSLKNLTEEELDVSNLMDVTGLAIYGDYLYWVDAQSGKLNRVNKMTGQGEQHLHRGIKEPTAVLVVDKHSFDVNHPCIKNNSGCSHLCYVSHGQALCSCPKYLNLGDNKRTCEFPPTCGPNHFRCKNGACVHMAWRCDGASECPDGSDEENCPPMARYKIMKCKKGSFVCSDDKSCIPAIWKCDGVKDCSGGSDEDPHICGNG